MTDRDVNMEPIQAKRPRGRPIKGAALVDGIWQMPQESIEELAVRLGTHRRACRERYRMTRQVLKQAKPEMFPLKNGKKRNCKDTDGTLRQAELPVGKSLQESLI